MATRRGFLGALFGGAAATAGGLLIPKAVAAEEKIEVSATPEMAESLRKAGEGEIIAYDAASLPDEFFESRTNLYQQWWKQASMTMWAMSDTTFNAFIEAHVKVNKKFGIFPDMEKEPWLTESDEHLRYPLGNADREAPVPMGRRDEYV